MSNRYYCSVSTYLKSDALRAYLKSALEHGYDKNCHFNISDDGQAQRYTLTTENNPNHPLIKAGATSVEMDSAKEVWEEFKGEFASGLSLCYGASRGGISKNKNRGIRYFLEKQKGAQFFCMTDDDIVYVAPGLFEELEDTLRANTNKEKMPFYSISHINLTWSDPTGTAESAFEGGSNWNTARDGWFKTFPVEALSDDQRIEYRKGAMGCCCFFTRQTIEDIMYMGNFGGSLYGYEHSTMSGRSLLKTDKRSPVLLPSYYYSEQFIQGQAVPNAYGGTVEEAAKADPFYQKALNDLNFGIGTKIKDHGLNIKTEVMLDG